MASVKDLKKRIGTVKNTQQTTRAMKMVSAAKLRRAQDAITNQRPYARQISEFIHTLLKLPEVTLESPLLDRGGTAEGATGPKHVMIVCVTSDRGLCGGFNGNVIKAANRWMRENASKYDSVTMGFVGRKSYDFFKTKKVTVGLYEPDLGGKVSFAKAKRLTGLLMDKFMAGEITEVKFIYNEFKNAVTQRVMVEDFLPLREPAQPEATPASAGKAAEAGNIPMIIVKPSVMEVFQDLLSKHFAIQAFRIMLESQAGEHGARMSAMENATKNAGEMIRKLTLQYNKQRQAGITKELLEIISGSESQKGA